MVGTEATNVLKREVNAYCIDNKIDGEEIWKEIISAPTIPDIQTILDKKLEGAIIITQ